MDKPILYPRLRGSIEALTIALDVRDNYTRGHCERVVRLAMEMGIACRVTDTELDYLRIAGRFHDVGKIGTPDAVLRKAGPLTPDEWALMRTHSEQGERIFSATGMHEVEPLARIIRHHHEAYDGQGYPDGLSGEDIPLASRIILVVDAYDAMSTNRPYAKARSHPEIMKILESEAGKKLDPEIFKVFAGRIEHSPARVA